MRWRAMTTKHKRLLLRIPAHARNLLFRFLWLLLTQWCAAAPAVTTEPPILESTVKLATPAVATTACPDDSPYVDVEGYFNPANQGQKYQNVTCKRVLDFSHNIYERTSQEDKTCEAEAQFKDSDLNGMKNFPMHVSKGETAIASCRFSYDDYMKTVRLRDRGHDHDVPHDNWLYQRFEAKRKLLEKARKTCRAEWIERDKFESEEAFTKEQQLNEKYNWRNCAKRGAHSSHHHLYINITLRCQEYQISTDSGQEVRLLFNATQELVHGQSGKLWNWFTCEREFQRLVMPLLEPVPRNVVWEFIMANKPLVGILVACIILFLIFTYFIWRCSKGKKNLCPRHCQHFFKHDEHFPMIPGSKFKPVRDDQRRSPESVTNVSSSHSSLCESTHAPFLPPYGAKHTYETDTPAVRPSKAHRDYEPKIPFLGKSGRHIVGHKPAKEKNMCERSVDLEFYACLREHDFNCYRAERSSQPNQAISQRPKISTFYHPNQPEYIHKEDMLVKLADPDYRHKVKGQVVMNPIKYEWNLFNSQRCDMWRLFTVEEDCQRYRKKQETTLYDDRDRYPDIQCNFHNVVLSKPMRSCTPLATIKEVDPSRSLIDLASDYHDRDRRIDPTLLRNPVSQYINANWVPSFAVNDAYICTQGPKTTTISHFWRMVYENQVTVVVMLTGLEESSGVKCAQYWPDQPKSSNTNFNNNRGRTQQDRVPLLNSATPPESNSGRSRALYDGMLVELVSEKREKNHYKRELIIYDLAEVHQAATRQAGKADIVINSGGDAADGLELEPKNTETTENLRDLCLPSRRITQYHFIGWRDQHAFSETSLLDFQRKVRTEKNRMDKKNGTVGPLVIHCSAGAGRTGSYVLLDSCLEQLHLFKKANVANMLAHLRYHRTNFVQTPEQYEFVFRALGRAIELRNRGEIDYIRRTIRSHNGSGADRRAFSDEFDPDNNATLRDRAFNFFGRRSRKCSPPTATTTDQPTNQKTGSSKT